MDRRFNSLPQHKQLKIVNSALREFGRRSYKSASTETIAHDAEISKGTLFNYFESKKGLYSFLISYVIDEVMQNSFNESVFSEADFIERMNLSISIRLELMKVYPDMFEFLLMATRETDADISSVVNNAINKVSQIFYNMIFEGIDYTRFRDGIDVNYAIKIITWIFKGFGDEVIKKNALEDLSDESVQCLVNETKKYIDISKKLFYKQEVEA